MALASFRYDYSKLQMHLQCKYCLTDEYLIEHGADNVCTKCGLCVGSPLMYSGQEWRSFEDDSNDKSRVGAWVQDDMIDYQNLYTYIEQTPGSNALIKTQAACTNQSANRLRDSSMRMADNMFNSMGFPLSVEKAVKHLLIYMKPEDIPRMHGLDESLICAVFIYQAFRSFDLLQTFEEIARKCGVRKHMLQSTHTLFQDFLHNQLKGFETTDPIILLDGMGRTVAERMGRTPAEIDKLLKILHLIQKSTIGQSSQAKTKVALGVYLVFGTEKSINDIASAVGITVAPVKRIIDEWAKATGLTNGQKPAA